MTTTLVDRGWGAALERASKAHPGSLKLICPFIKYSPVARLLPTEPGELRIITRWNLDDFAAGVSDIAALRLLLQHGGRVRGLSGLHSKVYIFGNAQTAVTSANITSAAFERNAEFGVMSDESESLLACNAYFEELWNVCGQDLKVAQLDDWDISVREYLAKSPPGWRRPGLGDYGAKLPQTSSNDPMPNEPPAIVEAGQSFVKFLGDTDSRVPFTYRVLEEIDRSGCNLVLGYPTRRKPISVRDGDLMFLARLTENPNDTIIFGRAIALAYEPGRDDATSEEIQHRKWRAKYQRYIRVAHVEFVAGTLNNGVSMYKMMDELGFNSFVTTQENAAFNASNPSATRNVNPRHAYSQAPAVRLSMQGRQWIASRLQDAFDRHGTTPPDAFAHVA